MTKILEEHKELDHKKCQTNTTKQNSLQLKHAEKKCENYNKCQD